MIRQATMNQETYLRKNTRGIYFFRARIPKQFSEFFNCSELKTVSFRLAVKLARVYRIAWDKEMDKFEKGTYSTYHLNLNTKTNILTNKKSFLESEIEGNLG
jgi:hypothetical protein